MPLTIPGCKYWADHIPQMYPVNQRGPDPSGGQDPGHHYQRHDGGEGDADAEGERDYEVG